MSGRLLPCCLSCGNRQSTYLWSSQVYISYCIVDIADHFNPLYECHFVASPWYGCGVWEHSVRDAAMTSHTFISSLDISTNTVPWTVWKDIISLQQKATHLWFLIWLWAVNVLGRERNDVMLGCGLVPAPVVRRPLHPRVNVALERGASSLAAVLQNRKAGSTLHMSSGHLSFNGHN